MRGEELKDYSVMDFFTNTYEEGVNNRDREHVLESTSARGRPRSQRSQYMDGHPRATTHVRVVRAAGHNTLPNFVGSRFPRNDDEDIHDFYCASMLMLLKPWRNLANLKNPSMSWSDAFSQFVGQSTQRDIHKTLSGIQLYHRSFAAVQEDHRTAGFPQPQVEPNEETVFDDMDPAIEPVTMATLAQAEANSVPWRDELYGQSAVAVGRLAGRFGSTGPDMDIDVQQIVSRANGEDAEKLLQWQSALSSHPRIAPNEPLPPHSTTSRPREMEPTVKRMEQQPVPSNGPGHSSGPSGTSAARIPNPEADNLLPDQRRAYDIVTWHLDQTLAGNAPPQLLMQMQGEGGTGKSRTIQAITEAFARRGVRCKLAKSAFTGVAAGVIDGTTLHSAAGISTLR